MTLSAFVRYLVACAVCAAALVLPYRARVRYSQLVAWVVHAPTTMFGRLARHLLQKLGIDARSRGDGA